MSCVLLYLLFIVVDVLTFLTGVLYGMGSQAAAVKLGIDVASASRITQAFFDHFKQIKVWIQQIKAYVECFLSS